MHFCLSAYLCHHRQAIAQTFMVDSPNDALQTYRVSGRNSPRGRDSGQKSLKNPENPEKLSPGRGGGGTGVGDHFGTFPPISVSIDGSSHKLLWWIALVKLYKTTSFWVQTHRGAGSVGKKVFKIRNPYEASYQMGCHAKL